MKKREIWPENIPLIKALEKEKEVIENGVGLSDHNRIDILPDLKERGI